MIKSISAFAMLICLSFAVPSGAQAETIQISIGGQSRSALLERPSVQGPRPTIIMLHGAGRRAVDIASETGLPQIAPRAGWVAVFPEGRGSRWNFLPPGKETAKDVQFFQQHGGLPDDVGFLRGLVAELVRRGVADPKLVYISGLSLGGFMALRMACADAGIFAGVGLLISAMPEATGEDCRPARALPLLTVSGTSDPAIPFAGGPNARGDRMWSAGRLVAFFRRLNGCVEPARPSAWPGTAPNRIDIESSAKCNGGPVVLYRVVGGGHDVPSALNAGQVLLDFFRETAK